MLTHRTPRGVHKSCGVLKTPQIFFGVATDSISFPVESPLTPKKPLLNFPYQTTNLTPNKNLSQKKKTTPQRVLETPQLSHSSVESVIPCTCALKNHCAALFHHPPSSCWCARPDVDPGETCLQQRQHQ